MKKFFIKIATIAIAASIVCGCGKFLTEEPTTSVYEDMAVGSEAALEADMVGIYSSLSFFESLGFFYYIGAASKMQEYTGTKKSEDHLQTNDLTMWSRTAGNITIYSNLYTAVNRCNTLIANLKKSPVDESYKKNIEGEARFMRGWYYFTLARLYGDLPLLTEPCETEEDSFVKRSPYPEVYAQIVDDLNFGYENMRDKATQEAINPGRGRSCNMAAKAALASVYTWIANYMETPEEHFFDCSKPGRLPDFSACGVYSAKDAWTKALEAAEDVMISGVYSLEPDFRHLFRWDPDNYPQDYNSPERIITFQASPVSLTGGVIPYMLWDNPVGTLSNYIRNGNAGRIRASRWVFQNWCERHGGLKEKVSSYEIYTYTDDPRFDASYFHSEVWGVPAGADDMSGQLTKTVLYPSEGRIKTSASSDPFIRKYFSAAYKCDNGDADMYVMRYAEVFLIAAEAAARLSVAQGDANWNKAIDYVNFLFARARASYDEGTTPPENPKDWKYNDFATRDELILAIFWERTFELSNEGHEWFDTHHMGAKWLSENICKKINEFNALTENTVLRDQFNNSRDIEEDPQRLRGALLLAFPEYELRYNLALSEADQNDFYIQ